jgi:hypothetical protein
MGYWKWKNERGFTTTLAQVGLDGTERRAELVVLYAARGLGLTGTNRSRSLLGRTQVKPVNIPARAPAHRRCP